MDEMFQLLWQKYRTWADTSARLKKTDSAWKRNVAILTLGGTTLSALGPFAPGIVGRAMPLLGAAALALATYIGKGLLDSKNEERWTRARAAAEAFKSEAHIYVVQVPPYDGPDRATRLKARIQDLNQVAKDQQPDEIPADRATKGMPSKPWTIDEYLTNRVQDQIDWYRAKAREGTAAMKKGRAISLTLGGIAVLLSTISGATAQGATLIAAILGIITTAAGSIGAYVQAGHFAANALKYRETADALATLKAEFKSALTVQSQGELVANAEAIMRAENAGWLAEVTAHASG
jgi:SMODS and SLOG-associating 2TM effector domain 1/SMODS and SLOG-associating 2TM effector domain 3